MEIVPSMQSHLFFFFDFVCDVILFENEVYILINSVQRFDDTMGSVHLSSSFASPSSCTCMVVETKGLCGACLTAQDRPSLWRWPWLRCSGLGKKKMLWKKRHYYGPCELCAFACPHTYTYQTHIYTATYPLNILVALLWVRKKRLMKWKKRHDYGPWECCAFACPHTYT